MRGLIDQTLAAYGRIDILVNNAGAVARELTHELSVESWETAMGIMGEWYNGYRFAKAAETDLYNTEFRRLHLLALAPPMKLITSAGASGGASGSAILGPQRPKFACVPP